MVTVFLITRYGFSFSSVFTMNNGAKYKAIRTTVVLLKFVPA